MKTALHILSHVIFWTWNLGFLGVMYLWFLPMIAFWIMIAAREGAIEPTFVVSTLGLLIVPLICTVLGGVRLQKHPILLMRLFYGVEAPLFTLCLLRLFLIREMTPASAFLMGLLAIGIALFGIEILTGYAAYKKNLAWVQMVGHSVLLVAGLYVGTLLLLYTVPALCVFLYNLFEFSWLREFGWYVLHPFFVIFGASCLVFLSMPYLMVNFYVRSWYRIFSAFGKQHGYGWSWLTTGAMACVSVLLFFGLQTHPQAQAFDLLESPPQTAEARQELINQSDDIRAGLMNAYLSRYRYLSPWEESNQLREMYMHVFDLPESVAQRWQDLHNGLLSPFLYQGSSGDIEKATDLYADFFDQPIQKGESATIRQALQATANRDETQAGLLNLDQKVIRLAEQAVTVQEHGDNATVEIHELYENSTFQDQEIFYSFSLPETAVINGLWLGEDETSPRFPFVVSPRGAAQQVYTGEVERSNFVQADDPALLEQVGPRQYRLRVFPIPAATTEVDRVVSTDLGQLHLWMTYQVMQQDGQWPLPQLTEKRNIFWTGKTHHLRQGTAINLSEDEWFEASIPAQTVVPAKAHQIDLEEGYRVTATPANQGVQALPQDQHYAVVLDSSYSMARHQTELTDAFRQLTQVANHNNSLDFYLTTATGEPLTPTQDIKAFQDTVFYGSLQPAEMLQQFEQQYANNNAEASYDAVLLLTDEGSYELSEEAELPAIDAPVWMVHLGGQLPSAYEDSFLQLLQSSRGGVTTDVLSALQRVPATQADESAGDVIEGYRWQVMPTTDLDAAAADSNTPSDTDFAPLAARQLILQQSRTQDMTQLETLDTVHGIAKRTGIVTPYSSMLVLVNDRQRELLREAEAGADRFDREVEDGQDELTNPGNPLNAVAVPEPGQVVSLALVAMGLIVLKRRELRQKPRTRI